MSLMFERGAFVQFLHYRFIYSDKFFISLSKALLETPKSKASNALHTEAHGTTRCAKPNMMRTVTTHLREKFNCGGKNGCQI